MREATYATRTPCRIPPTGCCVEGRSMKHISLYGKERHAANQPLPCPTSNKQGHAELAIPSWQERNSWKIAAAGKQSLPHRGKSMKQSVPLERVLLRFSALPKGVPSQAWVSCLPLEHFKACEPTTAILQPNFPFSGLQRHCKCRDMSHH